MVLMNIDENIKKMTEEIERLRMEALRLEGGIKMLEALKEGGLKEIDLPELKKVEKEEKITEIN